MRVIEKIFGFVKRHGAWAASLLLNVAFPGNPVAAVLSGLLSRIDDMHRSGRVERVEVKISDGDCSRIEAILTILEGDLGKILGQLTALKEFPEEGARLLAEILRVDQSCQAALHKLTFLAERFDCLEDHMRELLARQSNAANDMDQILPLLRRIIGVADYVDELRAAGLSPADFQKQLLTFQEGVKALMMGRFVAAKKVLGRLPGQKQSAVVQQALAGIAAALHGFAAAQPLINQAKVLESAHTTSHPELLPLRRLWNRVGRIAGSIDQLRASIEFEYPKDFHIRFWEQARCAVVGCLYGGVVGLGFWGMLQIISLGLGASWDLGGWIASCTGLGGWIDWISIGSVASTILTILIGRKYITASLAGICVGGLCGAGLVAVFWAARCVLAWIFGWEVGWPLGVWLSMGAVVGDCLGVLIAVIRVLTDEG